ncbi:MAG: PAS domain S-box protein [Chloroflexia bacterium]
MTLHERGGIIDANQIAAAMFGYEASELRGISVLDLTDPGSRKAAMSNIEAGSETPYESVGLRKDGSTFPVEVCSRSISCSHS